MLKAIQTYLSSGYEAVRSNIQMPSKATFKKVAIVAAAAAAYNMGLETCTSGWIYGQTCTPTYLGSALSLGKDAFFASIGAAATVAETALNHPYISGTAVLIASAPLIKTAIDTCRMLRHH